MAKLLLNLGLLFVSLLPMMAQNNASITVQTDLLDPVAKGASLWLNFDKNNHRVFVAGGFNELPDLLNPLSDDFKEKRDYFVQLGYGYRLGKNKKWILGAQAIYQDFTAIAKKTAEEKDLKGFRLCPIVFYEWKFLKSMPKLSLTPWASYRIDLLKQTKTFSSIGKTYQTDVGSFAMGFNLGYTF